MLSNISIPHKLALAFGLVMATVVAMVGYVYVTSAHVVTLTQINDRYDTEQALSAEAEKALLSSVANYRGYLSSRDPVDLAAYRENLAAFDEATGKLAAMLDDPSEKAELARAVANAQQWARTHGDAAIARLDADARRALQEGAGAASKEELHALLAEIDAIRTAKYHAVQESLEEMGAAAKHEEWAVLGGGLLLLVLTFALWATLCNVLGQPVVRMTRVMRSLADGDNKVAIPHVDRGDEIGAMARAVLVFRDTAVAKEAADAEQARNAAEQRAAVEALSAGLHRLSEGDLTARIGDDFPESYATIRTNFNAALQSLCTLIGSVMRSAASIRGSASEIAEATDNLARRTEGNAASIEETTAAISQMDGRSRATSQAADGTVAGSAKAVEAVTFGRGIVENAVQTMQRVADNATGIDAVIEGLDKIAFQTRVLAMNAAVEAGRAGEAGRGFAVVADLVSALAMRAEEEAGHARTGLSATRAEITAAVEAVAQVDGALAGISDSVSEVKALIGTMAEDNRAQAATVGEISATMHTMDQATQQNAAMVEETAAATRSLSAEVNAMVEQASRFCTGEEAVETHGSAGRQAAVLRRPMGSQLVH